MNLFGFHITRAAKKSFSPSALWLRGEDLESGGSLLTNAYQQVVWVYRAINVLAEQVANVPFLFSAGERGRENLITHGPLIEFYSRPHSQINRFQYWELRVIWLMLRGECFRLPLYEESRPGLGGGRRLKAVLMLDPARFQHIVEDHRLVGWRYTGFGPQTPLASQVFLPEEVWFEKIPNPFDFWRGLPPLYAAAMAARTDFAASAFMRGIIENNADSGIIVRADKPLAPEQQEQLFAALRQRKRRAGSADQPLLLTGCAEVIKPQLSSSDLQFLENRKFSRSEICAAFGVPEEILTATEHAKYDVMQGARLNFIENRVAPLCGRLEAEEDQVVGALDANAVGWFDLDSLPIMQQARRERLASARTGFDMGIPFNELNRVLDLGFKALPWGDTGYLGSKLQQVGRLAAGQKIQPASAELLSEGLALSTAQLERAELWFERLVSNPDRWSAANGSATPGSSATIARLRRFFFEQRQRVLAALAGPGPGSMDAWLDLRGENEKLMCRLEGLSSAAVARKLTALNQVVCLWIEESVRAALAQGASRASLMDGVRAIYNRVSNSWLAVWLEAASHDANSLCAANGEVDLPRPALPLNQSLESHVTDASTP